MGDNLFLDLPALRKSMRQFVTCWLLSPQTLKIMASIIATYTEAYRLLGQSCWGVPGSGDLSWVGSRTAVIWLSAGCWLVCNALSRDVPTSLPCLSLILQASPGCPPDGWVLRQRAKCTARWRLSFGKGHWFSSAVFCWPEQVTWPGQVQWGRSSEPYCRVYVILRRWALRHCLPWAYHNKYAGPRACALVIDWFYLPQ